MKILKQCSNRTMIKPALLLLLYSISLLSPKLLASTASERPIEEKLSELVGYLDKSMQKNIVQGVISSAGIVVVHKDKTVFKKGYGYHDWGKKQPINLQSSLFEVGSNSKIFTTLAILNLYDLGKIDSFDDPANKYLRSMTLPNFQGKEVTIHQLMTHTSGFESKVFGMQLAPEDSPLELQDYVHNLVREPGKYNSYSNFNIGALGIIIEDITGMPYKQYMEQEIFKPLGMNNTTIWGDANNPSVIKPRYDYRELFSYSPMSRITQASNGMVTSINDMEVFLKRNMQNNNDNRLSKILNQRMSVYSKSAMFQMVYPWWYTDWNGSKVYRHGGLANGTMAQPTIIKDQEIGIFWALQSLKASPIETRLFIDSLEILLGPYQLPSNSYKDDKPLSDYVGHYRAGARAVTTSESVLELIGQQEKTIHVNLNNKGQLVLGADENILHKIGPDKFYYGNSSYFSNALFQFEESGKVNMLLSTFLYEKVNLIDNPDYLRKILLYVVISITALTSIILLIGAKCRITRIFKICSAINLTFILLMALLIFDGLGFENRLIIDLIQSDSSRLIYLTMTVNLMILSTLIGWLTLAFGVYIEQTRKSETISSQWLGIMFLALSLFSIYLFILSRFNLVGSFKI